MKIIIAEAAHSEKGSGHYGYDGSEPGDQLQETKVYNNIPPKDDYYEDEVRFHDWYNLPWKHIYRWKNENAAKNCAIRAEQAVRQPRLGYSQPGRLGFYKYMMKNPDPSLLYYDTECDCSSMVNSIVYRTLLEFGMKPEITGTEVTAQMADKYSKMCNLGYFEDVIDKVNLSTGSGIKLGDILLGAPATHTAIICYVEEKKTYNKTPQWIGQVYNCSALNVRTGPAATYPNYQKYPVLAYGEKVAVCDQEGNWYYVRIEQRHYAWVCKSYITGEKITEPKKGKVTLMLCLRKEPINGAVLRYMPVGSEITILGEVIASNGVKWYEALYKGSKGYCSSKYITLI